MPVPAAQADPRAAILDPNAPILDANVGGIRCERIGETASGPVLVYLHGGGFMFAPGNSYRRVLQQLARRIGVTACMPRYRLAPEFPFPAAVDDCLAVYSALVAEGRQVVIAGDSAGGGLAASLVLRARAADLALPAELYLMSPREQWQVDPFAATVASVEKMWMDAENNRVARSMWRLRRANPELRTIFNEVTTPPMRESVDWRTGRVVSRPDAFALKNDPNVSEVWVDGQQKWMNWQNQTHAEIVKNLRSNQADVISGFIQKGTRWITRATTRDNIVFAAVVNPTKDMQEALFNAGVEYGPKVSKELLKNYPAAFQAVQRQLRGAETTVFGSRLSPAQRAVMDDFEQFRRSGGKLGNFQFRDIASRAESRT